VALMFRDAYHKLQPGIVFSVYSGYQNDFTKQKYGVDWSKLDGKIDRAMCGYGRPLKDLEETRKAIGSTPLTIGVISRPYELAMRYHPTSFTPAELARALCDSTGGILCYAYSSLDARSFMAIAKISNAMAKYEKYFTKRDTSLRSQVKVAGAGEECYEILKGEDGSILVALMNDSPKPKKVAVTLPGGYAKNTIEAVVAPCDFYMETVK